uniref:Uncharacterized protein n=1 Tax=Craspedostauros australis TaxID=1486917 RepID=A0A7R9WUR4_9STRA
MAVKYHRRLSNVATTAKPKYQRLGLLRTVDLSGKTIETYSKSQEPPRSSATGAMTYVTPRRQHAPEDVDELRETVVMEQILKAADVAHNLQGWKNLQTHSDRLYLELRRAHVQGREDNPQHGWFGNQIGFLENYLLPLARRLEDIGIFGEVDGGQFVRNVEANRDRWMKEGMQVTTNIVKVGETLYPE